MIKLTVKFYKNCTKYGVIKDGKFMLHNPRGPAIEYKNGYKEYYVKGVRHRLDGPALIEGTRKEFWVNGKRHNLLGPAVEYFNYREYWVNGEQLSLNEFNSLNTLTFRFNYENNRYEGSMHSLYKDESFCGGKLLYINGKKFKLVEEK